MENNIIIKTDNLTKRFPMGKGEFTAPHFALSSTFGKNSRRFRYLESKSTGSGCSSLTCSGKNNEFRKKNQ